ncbi:calcium-binding protein [Mesorhizobium sp. CN2-181]|uniref:calcium-binding protein n=1 Tax=Mesorhizobium yinganensis TaxID=3157707 RepID=UPI0032B8365A
MIVVSEDEHTFSLDLSGGQLTATLVYDPSSGDTDTDLTISIGSGSTSIHRFGAPAQLKFVQTLAPGETKPVTYEIDDQYIGAFYSDQFNVVNLDTATVFVGTGANDVVFGSSGDDVFHAGGGTNAFDAGEGNDTFVSGGLGQNRIYGRLGTDTVDYSGINFGKSSGMSVSLATGRGEGRFFDGIDDRYASIENVIGTNFNDVLQGSADANELSGNDGNDLIRGFNGEDVLRGGAGDDMLDGGADADVLEGGAGRDELRGEDGNDTLNGGAGADSIWGLGGDDVILILPGDDAVGEIYDGGEAGTDTLRVVGVAKLTDDIIQNIEELELAAGGEATIGIDQLGLFLDISTDAAKDATKLTVVMGATSYFDFRTITADIDADIDFVIRGDAAAETIVGTVHGDDIVGDAGMDLLSGWDGDDSLYGGTDNDVLTGGLGADYLSGGLGIDTADYSAAATGVTLSLANIGAGAGEAAGDTFNSVENVIGSQFGDSIEGSNAINSLFGGGGNDKLGGGGGDDILTGGIGADALVGGAGIDTASYAAAAAGITASLANASANKGDAAGDTYTSVENLEGTGFADQLTGDAGDNLLKGNAGNDRLDGGLGTDRLEGGAGDDIFLVSDASDVVVEVAGQGADRVMARVSYVLGSDSNIELLTTNGATGTGAINLTGNAQHQEIIGNAGANVLSDGKGGADVMYGLGGNDIFAVYDALDVIVERIGEGSLDRVSAAVSYTLGKGVYVEQLTTTSSGGISKIDLTGNEFVQAVIGNAGANRIDGKGGSDTLTGSGGADTFVFSTKLGAANVDRITDFSASEDTVALENTVFNTLTVPGGLAASAFRANASGLAEDASDRIIYEIDTGKLWYDEDGTDAEAAIHFATLKPGLTLTAADFVVI